MKIAAKGELYGRAVEEWIGATPDTPCPDYVVLRILLRQERKCAITGVRIRPGDKAHADHIKRLKDGGENRESNIQIVRERPHIEKTADENTEGARVASLQKKSLGIGQTISQRKAFQSKFKRKVSGEVVLRQVSVRDVVSAMKHESEWEN